MESLHHNKNLPRGGGVSKDVGLTTAPKNSFLIDINYTAYSFLE